MNSSKLLQLLVISMVSVLFFTSLSSVGLAKDTKESKDEAAEINEAAEKLEFLWEKASVKDEYGNIIEFDIELLENKYGKSSEFEELKEFNENPNYVLVNPANEFSIMLDDMNKCFNKKAKEYFGSFLKPAAYAAIAELVWAGKYNKAALRLIKLGAKGSVFGIIGSLVAIRVSCA